MPPLVSFPKKLREGPQPKRRAIEALPSVADILGMTTGQRLRLDLAEIRGGIKWFEPRLPSFRGPHDPLHVHIVGAQEDLVNLVDAVERVLEMFPHPTNDADFGTYENGYNDALDDVREALNVDERTIELKYRRRPRKWRSRPSR
jgi:hypothetical protein